MKVSLCTQLFSLSTANSLQLLLDEKHPHFLGCEATIEFVRIVDSQFEIFNSSDWCAIGSKRPLNGRNAEDTFARLASYEPYLLDLTTFEGKPLVQLLRKTAFVGYLVNIHHIKKPYGSKKARPLF